MKYVSALLTAGALAVSASMATAEEIKPVTTTTSSQGSLVGDFSAPAVVAGVLALLLIAAASDSSGTPTTP